MPISLQSPTDSCEVVGARAGGSGETREQEMARRRQVVLPWPVSGALYASAVPEPLGR